ncbi:class F sortase [Streptomyces sp. NPDC057494]|uniref:class F sortase n=1 Tax=Streptomyces sp. NPDC057494 TaxID=3346148 RepID=UPI0036BA24FB
MTTPPDPVSTGTPRRTSRWVVRGVFWAVALAVLLYAFGGKIFTSDATSPTAPPVPSATKQAPAAAPQPARPHASASSRPGKTSVSSLAMPRSAPIRLRIPKIRVDAPFTGLKIGPTGALDPPPADDTNLVGWQSSGISPGQRGTAIVAGHLDTKTSPAVFARLSELSPGDSFEVDRDDGTTAVFLIDSVENFHKDDFPDKRVYEDTPDALVRLITCAGAYNRTARDYTENLVVFAHLDTVG